MYSTKYVVDQTGATARQLNHWSDKGWLSGQDDKPGTGHHRAWSTDDLKKARLMMRFLRAGFKVEKAAVIARSIVKTNTEGKPGVTVHLADDMWLKVKGL